MTDNKTPGKEMKKLKIGDTVFYCGKKGKVLDIDSELGKDYAITYKIEINKPFQMRFWVHNSKLALTH